jgi:hypothetical protein
MVLCPGTASNSHQTYATKYAFDINGHIAIGTVIRLKRCRSATPLLSMGGNMKVISSLLVVLFIIPAGWAYAETTVCPVVQVCPPKKIAPI